MTCNILLKGVETILAGHPSETPMKNDNSRIQNCVCHANCLNQCFIFFWTQFTNHTHCWINWKNIATANSIAADYSTSWIETTMLWFVQLLKWQHISCLTIIWPH